MSFITKYNNYVMRRIRDEELSYNIDNIFCFLTIFESGMSITFRSRTFVNGAEVCAFFASKSLKHNIDDNLMRKVWKNTLWNFVYQGRRCQRLYTFPFSLIFNTYYR